MKVIYQLKVNDKVQVDPATDSKGSIKIGSGIIFWEADNDGKLSCVSISFSGIELTSYKTINRKALELSCGRKLYAEAYKLALYFSNRLMLDTSYDITGTDNLFIEEPKLEPENEIEKEGLKTATFSLLVSHKGLYGNAFYPNNYDDLFGVSAPLADFSDGLRAKSPINKYLQFYKVLEYFAKGKKGSGFNKFICSLAKECGIKNISQTDIQDLVDLRDRCTHSYEQSGTRKGPPVNNESLETVAEVNQKLDKIEHLTAQLIRQANN